MTTTTTKPKRTFKPLKDVPGVHMSKRLLTNDGLELYIHYVMFGHRVCVGNYLKMDNDNVTPEFIKDTFMGGTIHWNFCCGPSIQFTRIIYNCVLTLLHRGISLKELPPFSDIKPIYNDPEFMKLFESKMKEYTE